MKMGILSMVFLITMVWAGAQKQETEAATLRVYIEQLSETAWDGDPFLKTFFIGSNGTQTVALLQRSVIKDYLTVNEKIPVDSVETVIERNILFKIPYPLSDILNYHQAFIVS